MSKAETETKLERIDDETIAVTLHEATRAAADALLREIEQTAKRVRPGRPERLLISIDVSARLAEPQQSQRRSA